MKKQYTALLVFLADFFCFENLTKIEKRSQVIYEPLFQEMVPRKIGYDAYMTV